MANDCLVTKLKSTVDNSNLRTFGAIRLHVNYLEGANTNIRTFSIDAYGGTVEIKAKGNGGFSKDGTHYTSSSEPLKVVNGETALIIVDNVESDIEISNKYCLKRLALGVGESGSIIDVQTVDLMCPELTALSTRGYDTERGGLVGNINNINDIKAPKIQEFVIAGSRKVTGNIENLHFDNLRALYIATCPNIYGNVTTFAVPSLTQFYANNNYNLKGSITDFSGCLSLTAFTGPGTSIDTSNAALEEFATAQYNNGRTSGTVNVRQQNNTAKTISYSSEGYTIS